MMYMFIYFCVFQFESKLLFIYLLISISILGSAIGVGSALGGALFAGEPVDGPASPAFTSGGRDRLHDFDFSEGVAMMSCEACGFGHFEGLKFTHGLQLFAVVVQCRASGTSVTVAEVSTLMNLNPFQEKLAVFLLNFTGICLLAVASLLLRSFSWYWAVAIASTTAVTNSRSI